jgi:geranylgeranyl reductase family protein
MAVGGARVLLLDRARFPRDKPCGGGVTFRADSEGGIDLSPVTEREIYGVRISIHRGRRFEREHTALLARMTQRSRLDEYLVEQAVAAGTEFYDGVRVSSIDADGRSAIVRANGDAWQAQTVIGADGVNGVTARSLGLQPAAEAAVALEANYPLDDALAEQWGRFIGLDLAGIPGGYGWIFPKGDHLNVGVGGWKYVGPTLRQRLADLCVYYGLDPRRLFDHRGYQLPLRRERSPVVRGRAMLAGDAAALVDPLSGEGIWAAFVSGRVAADEALRFIAGETSDLRGYQQQLEREIRDDVLGSRRLQGVFQRLPSLSILMLKYNSTFWRYLTEIIRGDLTYPELPRKLGPLARVIEGWGDLETRLHERDLTRRAEAVARGSHA